jgi:hypothetical protein
MPRNVTLTFGDGTSHVYNGVPDDATPDAVIARAGQEFAGKQITNIDGGKQAQSPAPAGKPAPFGDARDNPSFLRKAGQVGRGAVSGMLGAPGDLENLGMKATTAIGLTKPEEKYRLFPSSEQVDKSLFGAPPKEGGLSTYRDIGNVGGALMSPSMVAGIVKGGAKAIAPGVKMVTDAFGRGAKKSAEALKGEAAEGVGGLIAKEETKTAAQRAIEEKMAGREGATVLEVSKPAAVDAAKVSSARTNLRQIDSQLNEANTKLIEAQRKLSSLDKYAVGARNESEVVAARRDLNVAQRDVGRLTDAKREADEAYKTIVGEHKAALKDAATTARQERTTADKIGRDAQRAKLKIADLQSLRAELSAEGATPQQIAGTAKKIGQQLTKSGALTEEQYAAYLGRVNKMVEGAKDTAAARKHLAWILGGATVAGAGQATGLNSHVLKMFMP